MKKAEFIKKSPMLFGTGLFINKNYYNYAPRNSTERIS